MYVGPAHHAHHNLVDGPGPTAPLLGSIAQNAAEKAEFGGDVRGAVGHCQRHSCCPDLSGSLTFEAWPEGSW
jgi:hypothetical protein